MKTLMERAENLETLWTLLLPTCDPPSAAQFIQWVSVFSDTTLEYGLTRASKKLHKGTLRVEDAGAFLSGTCRHEVENSQKKLNDLIAKTQQRVNEEKEINV